MNRPIALCCGEGFSMIFNWVELLCYIDNVVLTQHICNGLVARISFQNSLNHTIELYEEWGG